MTIPKYGYDLQVLHFFDFFWLLLLSSIWLSSISALLQIQAQQPQRVKKRLVEVHREKTWNIFFLKSINAYKRPIFCILYKSRVSLLWRFVCGLYKCPVFGVVNSIASTLEDTNKVATAMLRQRVELEKCWLFFNLVEARTSFDDKQHIAFSMQCVLSAWLLNPPRTDGRFPLSAATMLEALAPIGELHSSKELSGVGRAEMSESWVHGSINSDFRPLWYHWNSLDSRSPPSLSLCFCLYPLKLRPLKFSWCNAFEKKQLIFFCNWWANDYPYDIFFLSARN